MGVRAQTEATRASGRHERGVPVLMRRACTILSSNGELNLCNSCVFKVGFDEVCELCLCSVFKEGSVQCDREGSVQTIAAFELQNTLTAQPNAKNLHHHHGIRYLTEIGHQSYSANSNGRSFNSNKLNSTVPSQTRTAWVSELLISQLIIFTSL